MASAEAKPDLTSTVAKHYNELQEGGLEERTKSRIFYMRNLNNWIKSVLINEFMTRIKQTKDSHDLLTVLDLGSGKGGDLLKWRKANIDRLVCADIAETSVKQSEERYNEMVSRSQNDRFHSKLFSAEFITADCTKLRLKDMYKDNNTRFDMVSCQFAFHYCFESFAQTEMMIRNACEAIKPGGYFIGTTPNSYELLKRARNAEDKRSFGNAVYNVSFLEENTENLPLFGAKYDFHLEGVVDCPEFLVYFPAFEKIAEKYGMKLVYKQPFAEFFEEQVARKDSRTLLDRMQALEPYPPQDERSNLMSDKPNAYTASQSFVDKLLAERDSDDKRTPTIGTLSQDEWEAVTIYTVFAFQKVGPMIEPETAIQQTSHPATHAQQTTELLNEPDLATAGSQLPRKRTRSPESDTHNLNRDTCVSPKIAKVSE